MSIKFRKLRANEIDARVSTINDKGCSLLLYKDARVDQNILDETVGPENWQRSHEVVNGNLFCNVGIHIERNDGFGEWVWKQDVGTESYTEKEKGQASDSFKRACFNWGIGRELYSAPFIWIKAGDVSITDKNGKKSTYDSFTVKSIGYDDDGNINKLEIVNDKLKRVVYKLGKSDSTPITDEEVTDNEVISKKEAEILKRLCERKGKASTEFKGKKFETLTALEYAEAVRMLEGMPDKEIN